MKQLENILTRNNINFLKTDNQDLNILRDDRWVEMFNELGYEKGNVYFIDDNGPFFIVFPDNMISTATNAMLPDAINYLEEELQLNLQIPSNFGKIYTDESDDNCAIIIFNINELESILNQNINESKNLKNTIRLTESELHILIKESIKKTLKENEYVFDMYDDDYDSLQFYNYTLDNIINQLKDIMKKYEQNEHLNNAIKEIELCQDEAFMEFM